MNLFVGDRVAEAVRKAMEKHPQKVFYVKRMGFKTLHMFARARGLYGS